MKRLKVMTVVGTRPEIIRLSAVIRTLDQSDVLEHVLVHTGQNYDYQLNQVFFDDFQIKPPDYYLEAAGNSAMETIGTMLIKIDSVLAREEPDAFLILGDTNSCLCAIAAKKRHIPVFHMEAGNRCFDQRVPEEINRKIVDHISDINLPYSDIAREYLLQEGIPADRIIKIGSPMFEVLHSRKEQIEHSDILERLKLTEKSYYVVSAHREENIEEHDNFMQLIATLNEIVQNNKLPVIVSTHPRTRKKMEQLQVAANPLIRFMEPFGFHDYVKLQLKARAVLSDSGTISEESSILGFKALNIRQAHERPEAMEETAVIMTGLCKERILQCLAVLESQPEPFGRQVREYMVPNVSDKILRILLSYTDYINRIVWRKQ